MDLNVARSTLPPRLSTVSKFEVRAALLAGCWALSIDANAHGFGQRYDLPVPLTLFVTGAAAVVAVSFVVMAVFLGRERATAAYPHINLLRSRIGRAFAHPIILAGLRATAVALLLLILAAGFCGNQAPVKNIAPIMIWAIWWVGMAYICALLGDLWALINPLDTLFAWAEHVYSRLRRGAKLALELNYPTALAAWPAAALFCGFAWAELVWDESDRPAYVASAMLVYCAIAWTGMFLFGRRCWLERGETFALIFALFGRFAPTGGRLVDGKCEWVLRPYAVGLLVDQPVHASQMALVIIMLATVTFDGFMETPLWAEVADQLGLWLAALAPASGDQHSIVATLGLAGTVVLFLSIYLAFSRLIAGCAVPGTGPQAVHGAGVVARYFVFTLVPIAIGYHLAHYLSFLVMAAQYLIPLASDPFGLGWDLFGTTNYIVRIGIVDARFVWYASIAAIVAGHVAAVYLAHAMAMRVFGDRHAALRSQYPMLVLMVGYTMVSLWIIAQPIVSSRFG